MIEAMPGRAGLGMGRMAVPVRVVGDEAGEDGGVVGARYHRQGADALPRRCQGTQRLAQLHRTTQQLEQTDI